MADDEIRKLERELLAEGHEKIVRWVQGRLSMLGVTPLYRQDDPIFQRFELRTGSDTGAFAIPIPRDLSFRCTGISLFAECQTHTLACMCDMLGRASLDVWKTSSDQRFRFPVAAIRKPLSIHDDVKPGLPGLILNTAIDFFRGDNVFFEFRTLAGEAHHRAGRYDLMGCVAVLVFHGERRQYIAIPDPNLVDSSRPRREPLDLPFSGGPVMGGPPGPMTP